tara:strand:- start:485 stop:1108 length:624 start_codon:yes stop_codon:yes gene_type:complete
MPKKVNSKPKAKKASKKSAKTVVEPTPAPVEPTPAPAPPVVPTPVEPVVKAPPALTEFDYSVEISELQGNLKNALTIIKGLVSHVSKLEKRINRDRKIVEKKLRTKPRRTSTGLNGFSKPGPVSDELRSFLSMGKDDLIARTEVTKKITTYCQEKGLQKESDKRVILADKALTKLLRLPKGEDLTYFNLQKYMKVHFPNKEGIYPTL